MRPFTEDLACPKCGSIAISVRHEVTRTEHLACGCGRCRYEWEMACKEDCDDE